MKWNKRIEDRKFFLKDAEDLARNLLGKILVREIDGEILKGRIIETEAYLGLKDDACHSYGGKITKRTGTFYLNGGHVYIFLVYGLHHCFNIVSGDEKTPEAVLIRSLEPLSNRDIFVKRRFKNGKEGKNLLSGPGNVTKAFGITMKDNEKDLCKCEDLFLEEDGWIPDIISTKRIGIEYAKLCKDFPLRFLDGKFIRK